MTFDPVNFENCISSAPGEKQAIRVLRKHEDNVGPKNCRGWVDLIHRRDGSMVALVHQADNTREIPLIMADPALVR